MVNKIIIADSLSLSPENGYSVQEIASIGYSTKYSISDILSKHGVKIGNALFRNKAFSVNLLVSGNSSDQLISRRKLLFQYLSVKNYSPDDKIKFEFQLSNNLNLLIYGVIKDVADNINSDLINATEINFVIETEYPFFVTKKQYQVTIPVSEGGGCAIPMAIPLDMSIGAIVGAFVSSGGNVFSHPVIKLIGPLTNPVITDTTNGRTLSLQATIASDDYYLIDTYERTVLDKNNSNRLDKMSGEFLVINPGENFFKLLTDSGFDTGFVEVIYPYSYVSL